jgi:hypothetical protein
LSAGGRNDEADRILAAGHDWIARAAANQVPPEFRESFVERNPIDRALLTRAAARR